LAELEHAPLSNRRGEIARKRDGDPGAVRPYFRVWVCALLRAVSRDRFVLVERFRTIETFFTVFLRFTKIAFPTFSDETYQHL
jgi:hypothetical protein